MSWDKVSYNNRLAKAAGTKRCQLIESFNPLFVKGGYLPDTNNKQHKIAKK
jgi:hypothetical protein